jgi:tetratricopeptide (TPR) repeat protein
MKLNAISVQQIEVASDPSRRAQQLCALARNLEEAGEFEDARATISEYWQRIGERPRVDGLDDLARADVFLRAGALSGWVGSARQVAGAQEFAKDLITEAATIFEKVGLAERVAEAHTTLAVCYVRSGALDEARAILDQVLVGFGNQDSDQKLRAVINAAIVEKRSTRPREALRILTDAAPLFEKSDDHALKGKFHNEFATVLKNLGLAGRREDYIDRALMQYTAASFNFEKAGHKRFHAAVENNLGFLFVHLEKFEDAHQHLDRARSVLTNFQDKGLVAQVEDTRARAFLGQGMIDQAETVAGGAVKILREGDEQSLLAGVLTTHATALARLARHSEAYALLNEAVSLAGQAGDPESGGIAALTIVEELSSWVSPVELRNYYQSAESALAQSQHPEIRFRLGECARSLLDAKRHETEVSGHRPVIAPLGLNGNGPGNVSLGSQGAVSAVASPAISLEEQVLSYEGELIRRALQAAEGSVTRAARILGITHQGLAFILNGRHKNLLPARKPAKPRRRSIIRYH